MVQHLYIITGASRGMGLAMAEQLLSAEHTLLCISRHRHESLSTRADTLGCSLEQWSMDLERGVEVADRLALWLESRPAGSFASATLINNAGILPNIGPLSASNPLDLTRAMRVGLEAPLLLTAAFLRATALWEVPRKVLSISSGLGRRAMASQAAYCAAKAGLDHLTRCLALEEILKPNGAKVCSLAPGVVDTDMQLHLRSADAAAFPDQKNFLDLQSKGQLATPTQAASRVLAYLARPDFGNNPIGDVRE